MQAARHPAGNRVEESRKGGFRNRPGSTTNWINEAEQPTHLLHLLPGGEEEVDEVWGGPNQDRCHQARKDRSASNE